MRERDDLDSARGVLYSLAICAAFWLLVLL